MLIDSHAHLTKRFCTDVEGMIARAKVAGVKKIITVGTTLADSREGVEIAQKHDGVWAAVGIHPEEDCDNWQAFEELINLPKVVAIGECGLDYKVGQTNQKDVFVKQIALARKYDKPLIIHIRDAQQDLMKIDLGDLRGVFHCFSGTPEYLNFILEKLPNFYISFAGNVTFPPKADQPRAGKNASLPLPDLAKLVPLERILIETDSPFLAPHPLRGSQNEPANVKIVASKLAEIKNTTLTEIERITNENAEKLFGI